MIQAIEKVSDNKNREDLIKRRFNGLWPDFEKMIEEIPDRAPTEKHMRPQTEILRCYADYPKTNPARRFKTDAIR